MFKKQFKEGLILAIKNIELIIITGVVCGIGTSIIIYAPLPKVIDILITAAMIGCVCFILLYTLLNDKKTGIKQKDSLVYSTIIAIGTVIVAFGIGFIWSL